MRKVLVITAIAAGLGILFTVNPETASFMPKCAFHQLTGLDCPSCGSQRAIHQLLHLNFARAFAYNPFMIISLPYAAALIACQWYNKNGRFDKLKKLCMHPITVRTYFIMLIAWWIGRNVFL